MSNDWNSRCISLYEEVLTDTDIPRTLERINHFLRRLIKSPGRFTQHDEEQAREFMQTLNGLIVVRLDDFPIDQYALEMFRTEATKLL
ncbi:hypothetical protein C8R42DRAFT_692423 [Lentinula raphanica]|nr:hypothetical protein C8R42DRAFT_692423 [Lentinula raphanica]